MNSQLTTNTEEAIQYCADRFDGYAYVQATQPGVSGPEYLEKAQRYIESSGKFFANPLENMATNYYLHRMFHHWGWFPSAYSKDWYQMVFFYLHLYRLPTPATYRRASEANFWDNRAKGAAEAAAGEIRQMLMRRG